MPPSRRKSLSEVLVSEAARIPHEDHLGILPCEDKEGGLYPNVDLSIWLRSCLKEQTEPIKGEVVGSIPDWVSGSLLQNGPGKFYFGDKIVKHLFDGSAILQRYFIEKGQVYYTCRYLRTNHFVKNMLAGDVVTTEFATVSALKGDRFGFLRDVTKIMSDNTFISVYPLGEDYYCYYESPFITGVDPDTLETKEKVNLHDHWNVLTNGSHPHYDDHGNMLSIGMKVGMTGPEYIITKTPTKQAIKDKSTKDKLIWDSSSIVGKVRSRWMLDPGYMHSFSVTERYYILIEQPLTVNVPKMVAGAVMKTPFIDAMKWRGNAPTLFHVIDRITGEVILPNIEFRTDAFFFLHTINAYEDNGHIVIDISCYDRPDMLHCMYLESLQTAQSDPDYARLFRGRPQRFVIPLNINKPEKGENLIKLDYTKATAFMEKKGAIRLKPEKICDVGCETPTINYDGYNGKKYRYFYAITSDVDDDESAGKIFKVDALTGHVTSWAQRNAYCAEPMFVSRPGATDEDDGVVLSAMIKGKPDVEYTALVVLDAKTMKEIARAEFRCGGPVPKPLHGYFTGNNVSKKRAEDSAKKNVRGQT